MEPSLDVLGPVPGKAKKRTVFIHKAPSMRKSKLHLFECMDASGEVLQGIECKDGSYIVGLDAWRICNKMDTPSYPIKRYLFKKELLKAVKILPKRQKGYYLQPETEDKRWNTM